MKNQATDKGRPRAKRLPAEAKGRNKKKRPRLPVPVTNGLRGKIDGIAFTEVGENK